MAMRLSEFIRARRDQLIDDWESFARTLMPAAEKMTRFALRDHIAEILEAIAVDMEVPQSSVQQRAKSRGRGSEKRIDVTGETHAGVRIEAGFDLNQVISEYRALRATVISRWEAENLAATTNGMRGELTRFNESIDQILTEAVSHYTARLGCYREQFLAILAHDLRNPLGAITLSAITLTESGDLAPRQAKAVSLITKSVERVNRMVNDLLDLTRTRLGGSIPIARSPMDLGPLCRQVVEELEAFHADRVLHFTARGDLHGEWDRDRLAQVVSNLVANAMQHGSTDAPIEVEAAGSAGEIVLNVHNEGPPISPTVMPTLFEPLMDRPEKELERTQTHSLGLGLYIVREVVCAHGGHVEATSSAREGTTFTVHLPRHPRKTRHAPRPAP